MPNYYEMRARAIAPRDDKHVMIDGSEMPEEEAFLSIDRGAPIVASPLRWLALAAGETIVFLALGYGYLAFTQSKRTISSLAIPLAVGIGVTMLATWAMLRAEESRLARELRTARSGTPTIRGMVLGRRDKVPVVLRLFSTTLGRAALLLAEGERTLALDAIAAASPIMFGGRLPLLRAVVEADAERAIGSSVSLERAVQTLRASPRIGNREADLYRTHVLVKAVLEQAGDDTAADICDELARSNDEEERLYAVWLATWFELELQGKSGSANGVITEGEVRVALLLARSQGAEALVAKLEAALAKLTSPSPLQSPPPTAT